ncbi:MAG: MFS transporter [Desulfobacteraceae bacterium]|jgi:MFS family permease|nr:MFS transporter [Desulfobacteraceae bacterium]
MAGTVPKEDMYYGWKIVVLLFFTLISTAGNGFYAISVYVPRFIDELGCTTSGLMLAAAVWAIVFGFSNPIIGSLMHKHGVRGIFIIGVVCSGTVTLMMSFITQLWQLYALNLIFGFVGAATILVPCQTLITRWFNKKRGVAMALMMMGIGVGGFIIPQVIAWLIFEFGWRNSFRIGAVLNYILVLPPLLFFLKNNPSDVGQYIDGLTPDDNNTSTTQAPAGISAGHAVKTKNFWLLVGVYVLQLFVMSGFQMNIQNFAEKQMGYSLIIATHFMAFALFITLPARFIYGWLCDRYNTKYMMASSGFFLMGGAFVLWYFVIKLGWVNDYRAIGLFSFFQGFGIAGSAVVLPIMVGRCFGEREFPKILGLTMTGFAVGVLFGPFLMGKIFDVTGNYAGAFVMAMGVAFIAGILALFIQTDALKDEFTTFT